MTETTAAKNNVIVPEEQKELQQKVSAIEQKADALVITDNESFETAGNFAKYVKGMQNQVTEYWEPMRKSTYEAYKSVTDHKKQMLDPLQKAERIIKRKLSDYSMEQERIRREKELEMRRKAQEEMEKKLAEAQKAEESGDAVGAEAAMAEAEVNEGIAQAGTVQSTVSQVKGVSKRKAWRIVSIDQDKVPDKIAGVVIRPVDEKAVMNMIKATKGTVEIPGIKYIETVDISVSSK